MMGILHNAVVIALYFAFGLVILGVLVLVHELGHFLAAKSCGIRVIAFSIGFGKPLLAKKIGETEYRLSAIPFGGYVNMAGEHPEEKTIPEKGDFTAKPKWQRAFVALAGPAANYLFAMICLYVVFILGTNFPVYLKRPVVGAVADSSSAMKAGFKSGDSIVAMNGKTVSSWEDIGQQLAFQQSRYDIVFVRGASVDTLPLLLTQRGNRGLPKEPTGGLFPAIPPVVGSVLPGSPAEKAGFMANDTVTAINGGATISWDQLTFTILRYDGAAGSMTFTVNRGGSLVEIAVTPQYNASTKRYQIGVGRATPATMKVRYGPVPAVGKMVAKTWEYTTKIFEVLQKLFSKQVSTRELVGPIGIVQVTGIVALGGAADIIDFMAFIGINLAVLNLLPLIITDGGLLLFLLIEAVRRKPLSIKAQMIINRGAIFFFIFLFLYVTYNDIGRIPDLFRVMVGK
jgi:regulator of sigma E protease